MNPNKTKHSIYYKDARKLDFIETETINLVVTSPPYPMIAMWDKIFASQNKKISSALKKTDGNTAFELMHQELDKTWKELYRILKPGGIVCLNIGDATRTINQSFHLYPNHARIIMFFKKIGFDVLPEIIWRKQTNAPNKFMGSGMLPVGAYVTLEHEYILIFRKAGRRIFKNENEKMLRQESSFFWEERNNWFSDIWYDIKGKKQNLENKAMRKRSGAFPLELAYRLISMYSSKYDTVLDPFLGTGTTSIAAMLLERNSVGVEIDKKFKKTIAKELKNIKTLSLNIIQERINKHNNFIKQRTSVNKSIKYKNEKHEFPVMTKTERFIKFNEIQKIQNVDPGKYEVIYF